MPYQSLAALVAAGVTNVSVRTVARRMAEARPIVQAGRAAKAKRVTGVQPPTPPPPLPQTDSDLPDDIPMATLLYLLEVGREVIEVARAEGDFKAVTSAMNSVGYVEQRIYNRTPREADDPNDAPDMVALGADVEVRFRKMVDMVLEER